MLSRLHALNTGYSFKSSSCSSFSKNTDLPPRFAGGFYSQTSAHVVAQLDQEYSWANHPGPAQQRMRKLLLDGFSAAFRTDPLLGTELLKQFSESFPNTKLSPDQENGTFDGLELAILKNIKNLPGKPSQEILKDLAAEAEGFNRPGQRAAGAKAVSQALEILEDVT